MSSPQQEKQEVEPQKNEVNVEQKDKLLKLSAEMCKTIIAVASIVITGSLSFAGSSIRQIEGHAIRIWFAAALVVLVFSIAMSLRANAQIITTGKKLAGITFDNEKYNNKDMKELFRYATFSLNASFISFGLGAFVFLVFGWLFIGSDHKSFSIIASNGAQELERSQAMKPPIVPESFAKDKNKSLYRITYLDAANKRMTCEISTEGELNFESCYPPLSRP